MTERADPRRFIPQHPEPGPLSDESPYSRAMAERFVAETYHKVRASMGLVHVAVAEHNHARGQPGYAPITFGGTHAD